MRRLPTILAQAVFVGLVVGGLLAHQSLKRDLLELRIRAEFERGSRERTGDPHAPAQPPIAPAGLAADAGQDMTLWNCAGQLSQDEVQAVLAQHGREVFSCQEAEAPDVVGELFVELKVSRDGGIASHRIGGSAQSQPLMDCVRRAIRGWAFPPVHVGDCAVVELPFQFGPTT